MNKYNVIKYTSDFYNKWNDFIDKAKNATFLFHRDFMDYHNDKFEDFSLLIYKKEKLIAILPANIKNNEVFSHQGLSYGGLVLEKDINFDDVLAAFTALMRFLKEQSIKTIYISLLPKIYNKSPSDELEYLFFIIKSQVTRRDLSSAIEILNKSVITSPNRKRGLTRAKKNNLIVKEVDSFEDFWKNILIPNLKGKHNKAPVHSLEEITLLHKRFPKNIKQFNVYKESKIVAGVTIFETINVAHAQYIAANEFRQELGSLDLVFNVLINDIYKNKRYFDFGISNENQGRNINSGLLNWKQSFGASAIAHDFYEIEVEKYHLLKDVLI